MYGYIGKLLFIDLTKQEYFIKNITDKFARDYLGGAGFGAKILFEHIVAKSKPLSDDSLIGFVSGALNSTGALLAGRYAVVCKSPLTDKLNVANSGGIFGPMMRAAGYDGIFVMGKSAEPTYIYVENEKIEFKNANRLWGKTISQTFALLDEQFSNEHSAAIIGPGGENQQLSACVINDNNRAAGRGGVGAVMGAKNLKALVVSGNQKVQVANPEKLMSLGKEIMGWQDQENTQEIVEFFTGRSDKGTVSTSLKVNNRFLFNQACAACPIKCGGAPISKGGKSFVLKPGIIKAFGKNLHNKDINTIRKCNHLCDEYGLDTMQVGEAIAWAMECYKEGLLTKTDLSGIDLIHGNSLTILSMTEMICKSEGIGAILANGVNWSANYLKIGIHLLPKKEMKREQSEKHIDYRKHVDDEIKIKEKRTKTLAKQLSDLCGFCSFRDFGVDLYMQLSYINAATGWGINEEQYTKIANRVEAVIDEFNHREAKL